MKMILASLTPSLIRLARVRPSTSAGGAKVQAETLPTVAERTAADLKSVWDVLPMLVTYWGGSDAP
jgi:hypothetical protein